MKRSDFERLIREQDDNPRLKAKSDALMTLLNLNLADLCTQVEDGVNVRTLVRQLNDDTLTSYAAGLTKYSQKMKDAEPYARIVRTVLATMEKEAIRRNVKIPEYIVVMSADVDEDRLNIAGFKDVQRELGLNGAATLHDLLFAQIVRNALVIMTPVLDDDAPPRPLLEPLTSYKVENLAVFFNVCFDMIEEEPEGFDWFEGVSLSMFVPQMQQMLASCCDLLAERGEMVPKHIPLSRRGLAYPPNA